MIILIGTFIKTNRTS